MNILLISDAFPPMRTSAAVHMHDLACELARFGHDVTLVVPSPYLQEASVESETNFGRIYRIKTPNTKDVGYLRRTLAEFCTPYIMYFRLNKNNLIKLRIDGIVWYSPMIFFGPLVARLKVLFGCNAYLVLRDLFPDWTVDLGIIKKRIPYYLFKIIEVGQYRVADRIGVQCPGNIPLISKDNSIQSKVEVLWTWVGAASAIIPHCSINLDGTCLQGRKVCVYAGNMGLAQGIGILLDLAERLKQRSDVGFLFVGRGSDAQRLRVEAKQRALDNVVFFEEIDPAELPGLYAQCHVGLVVLDSRHKTHNIPGKFLSYMQAGLPVLASINPGNDLVELISAEQVGRVCTDGSPGTMAANALELIESIGTDSGFKDRCERLASRLFSPEVAVKQIVSALQA